MLRGSSDNLFKKVPDIVTLKKSPFGGDKDPFEAFLSKRALNERRIRLTRCLRCPHSADFKEGEG